MTGAGLGAPGLDDGRAAPASIDNELSPAARALRQLQVKRSSNQWRQARVGGQADELGALFPEPLCDVVVLGLGARCDHLLVFDVLAGERSGVVGQREPDQRAGAALRGAEKGRAELGNDLPDPVFVLGEAGAHDAGMEAVGVQLRRAPGQLAREQDVAIFEMP